MVTLRAVDILLATTLLGMIVVEIAIGVGRAAEPPAIVVSSPAFAASATIPSRFSCVGADDSPPLQWHGIPPEAKTLAVVVDDSDAPSGTFAHWIVYNIDPRSPGLPVNVLKADKTPGYPQGVNDFGKIGYNGPCPPPGLPHHYHFKVYALAAKLRLSPEAGARQLRDAMAGRIVAAGEMVAIFAR